MEMLSAVDRYAQHKKNTRYKHLFSKAYVRNNLGCGGQTVELGETAVDSLCGKLATYVSYINNTTLVLTGHRANSNTDNGCDAVPVETGYQILPAGCTYSTGNLSYR